MATTTGRQVGDNQRVGTPLRVAHVIHSLGPGGAESVLVELAQSAADAGMTLVVIGLSGTRNQRAVPMLQAAGAQVHLLGASRYDPSAVLGTARILHRERVDVVHTHLKHADVVGGLAARLLGLPVVSTLHVIETPSTLIGRLRVQLAARARGRLAARVIALSTAQRDWYASVAPSAPVVLLPNGVAEPTVTRDRDAVRRSLGVPPDGVLGVTVSLMRPEKGYDVLLEAVRRLPDSLPLVLALAGDGPLLDEVRRSVDDDSRLATRVRVLGFREDVPDLLAAADFVVHPSREDALPTALISALAASRVVLASRVGGIPDVTDPSCAVLVPPGDGPALAQALHDLVNFLRTEPRGRASMEESARTRYRTQFSAVVWTERLLRVYDEVLSEPVRNTADGHHGLTRNVTSVEDSRRPDTIAIVSASRPYPRDSGKSVVMAGLLTHLAARVGPGHLHLLHVGRPLDGLGDLDGVVVHEMGGPEPWEQLRALLVDVALRGRSLQEGLLSSRSVATEVRATLDRLSADLEIVDTLRMDQYLAPRPRGRRILYLDDLFSVRYQRMLNAMKSGERDSGFNPIGQFADHLPAWLRGATENRCVRRLLLQTEARRMRRSETRAASAASLSILLNHEEAELLRRRSDAHVEVIPPLVTCAVAPGASDQWGGGPDFAFIGLLSLAHNHDGLTHFLEEGMPELLRMMPDARLHVVGRGASERLLALAATFGGHVVMHGFVPDLDEVLGRSCALVNVLRFGSGVKIKVLEAFARGVPVVATPVGSEGIGTGSEPGLTIVAGAREAAAALARLTDAEVHRVESEGARHTYSQRFSPEAVAARYDAVFRTTPPGIHPPLRVSSECRT